MLTFTSLGGSAIRLTGGNKTLMVFPEESTKMPEKDFIALLPSPQEKPSPTVISWPGEYNEAGISIRGVGHVEGQQVSYVVEAEGVRTAFISLPLQDWTEHEIGQAGDIDVLVLPATDVKLVQKLVDELDPRVLMLVPTKDRDAFDAVLKAIGAHGQAVDEYKLKGQLPAEGREVVVLAK